MDLGRWIQNQGPGAIRQTFREGEQGQTIISSRHTERFMVDWWERRPEPGTSSQLSAKIRLLSKSADESHGQIQVGGVIGRKPVLPCKRNDLLGHSFRGFLFHCDRQIVHKSQKSNDRSLAQTLFRSATSKTFPVPRGQMAGTKASPASRHSRTASAYPSFSSSKHHAMTTGLSTTQ